MTALIVALVCLFANAFFVAAEFSMAKVRPSALEAMAKEGDGRAARALAIANKLDAYLTAAQFGITVASLGLGWLGEQALMLFLGPALAPFGLSKAALHGIAGGTAFALVTLLHIIVGESVPKLMAIRSPEKTALWTALPLRVFFLATYPVLWVLNSLSNWLCRLLGIAESNFEDGVLSPQELRVMVQRSFGADITDRRKDLIERVLRATDRPVRVVMVPRVDMVVMSVENDLDAALARVRKHGYSRYPLCEDGDPDHPIGYVYIKDVLIGAARTTKDRSLRSLKRELLFVPETMTVGDLLTEFQKTRIPVAIVVDEYGGTSGFVTTEDVVEEIVGDIRDEHDDDEERAAIVRKPNGIVLVDGKLPIGELELEGLVHDVEEGAETVGGFVIAALGRLAHEGDRVRLGAWEAVVEDVRRRRIRRVAFHPRTPTEPPPELRADRDLEPSQPEKSIDEV